YGKFRPLHLLAKGTLVHVGVCGCLPATAARGNSGVSRCRWHLAGQECGTHGAVWVAGGIGARGRGRRAFLPSLLYSINSAPCAAGGSVLCAALVWTGEPDSLVAATGIDVYLARTHRCGILNRALARAGSTARADRERSIFVTAFEH